MTLKFTTLALAAVLATAAAPAFAQNARLHCANGSVADTTSVTITGNTGRATRGSWSDTGRVETTEALYRIAFRNGGVMSINRSSGHAMTYDTPGGTILLRCSPGGPRM